MGDKLRKVGALWKPKPGARSLGSGMLTISGMQQRFVVLANDRKKADKEPDFVLMSADEPTVDTYVKKEYIRDEDVRF